MNRNIKRSRGLRRSCLFLAIMGVAVPLAEPGPALATHIYYADNNLATISRLTLDEGDPQMLSNTRRGLLGLAVDYKGGKIYWADNGPGDADRGKVFRSNLDGSEHETLYTASLPRNREFTGQLQLDPTARHIYWTDEHGDRIHRMNMDGTGAMVLSSLSNLGTALELDSVNKHLYFTTGSAGAGNAKIERIDLDGSNRVAIANVYGYSLALDIENENIYAADWFGQRLMRVGFDGTGLTQIAQAPAIRDVQVYNGRLYYPNVRSQAPDNTGPYFFQWVRSELDGSNPVVLYEVQRSQGPQDMIQFVVVPEPPLFASLAPLALLALRRVRTAH